MKIPELQQGGVENRETETNYKHESHTLTEKVKTKKLKKR